jgi:predicted ATPase
LNGNGLHQAELIRVKGELLLQQTVVDDCAPEVEECFRTAGDLAHAQGALFWELRIAISAARLHVSKGRPKEATRLLAPVYGCFAEGFVTRDLLVAKSLLVEARMHG